MIHIEDISKTYGATTALHPTSLELGDGRTTVLIGPSGCGKSTLLRIIVGLITPDTGRIRLGDATVVSPTCTADPSYRHRIGYVIQEGGLFPHLTASRNVGLLARYLGWSPDRIADRIRELAGLTQLPIDALDRYPGELSGGQRQRVALMRALMLDPEVLLLDEPLGALDPLIRAELQQDLRAIFRTLGKTVVLVTHDLPEAAFFGDTIVLMAEGRIVQDGSMDDLANRPAEPFVLHFIEAQRR